MKTVKVSDCGDTLKICVYTRATRWDSPRAKGYKREWKKKAWQAINFRNTRERLDDLIRCNFGPEDWHVVFTLDNDHNTRDYVQLRTHWRKALRTLREIRALRGGAAPVYIYVLEGLHGDRRLHIHALLRCQDEEDVYAFWAMWPYGDVLITPIEQLEHRDHLAQYLTKEPGKLGRDRPDRNLFVASRNCARPSVSGYSIPDDGEIVCPEGYALIHQEQIKNEFGSYSYLICRRKTPS